MLVVDWWMDEWSSGIILGIDWCSYLIALVSSSPIFVRTSILVFHFFIFFAFSFFQFSSRRLCSFFSRLFFVLCFLVLFCFSLFFFLKTSLLADDGQAKSDFGFSPYRAVYTYCCNFASVCFCFIFALWLVFFS